MCTVLAIKAEKLKNIVKFYFEIIINLLYVNDIFAKIMIFKTSGESGIALCPAWQRAPGPCIQLVTDAMCCLEEVKKRWPHIDM